ncbi:VVA0879 family protein [Pseudalkalibacillus berkeleyi]|uniref:Uncharacterized protein n=1 Tax=Pseudalkalibacillus berkeleyi TaxID=1069813 RepID=A0ABS9GYD7_9BACL|nr:VVA0879 family protein [Pseudalkalibacillus berkeleyi]MCF6136686.1 hypothetical protein [Pseudalkalibacillus berkeleyi]
MLKYSLQEWEMHGVVLYGKEKRNWYFQCPNCQHNQSVHDLLQEGYPPDLAYSFCKSCHYEAKRGTFGKGKVVEVNRDNNMEIFDFA